MLAPVDIQNKEFKGGIGFDKKEVETFINQVASDYEILYRSNVELKDKVTTLNESLQHYRAIEESMQKALTLSEKTAEETVNAANDKARLLSVEAEKKAESIVMDAKEELLSIKNEIYVLQQQHAKFKKQFKKVLESQMKILDGELIDIDLGADFEPPYQERNFYSGSGFSAEGGLGGLGGGYTGSSMGGFERTNQDPMFDRGSLNMDPFADAMNGGGRFSKQTGKGYISNSDKKKKTTSNGTLNIKEAPPKKPSSRTPRPTAPKATPVNDIATAASNMATEQTRAEAPKTAKAPVHTEAPKAAPTKATPNAAAQAPKPTPAAPKVKPVNVAPTTETPVASKSVYTETPKVTPTPSPTYPSHDTTYSGEVETKVNESTMLDSEDNYSEGFDFISEDTTSEASYNYDNTYSGEVETKVNESNMLDSEDNYSEGFDFVSEDDGFSFSNTSDSYDENTYSGEVETKVNESNMLDSEDNYSEGFDFLVGNEEEEEDIPTIFPDVSSIQPEMQTASYEEDVYEGDIEENINKSNLIGNDDDDNEGFSFL